MASKLTLIALALGATLISSACSEQSKPDKVAEKLPRLYLLWQCQPCSKADV